MCVCRFACRRANKTRSEALAYYNLGVLHDHDKEYDKANRCVRVCASSMPKAATETDGKKDSCLRIFWCSHASLHAYRFCTHVIT